MLTSLLLSLALATPARAASGAAPAGQLLEPSSPDATAASLTPSEGRVPPVRRPLDYTAWTLRPGELRVGLVDLDMGLLPRLTVSTQPLLDVLRVGNGTLKLGVVDNGHGTGLALEGGMYRMRAGDFHLDHARVGLRGSTHLGHLALHAGGDLSHLQTSGSPDLQALSPLVTQLFDPASLATAQAELLANPVALDSQVSSLTVRGAVELPLSAHHSLVAQGAMVVARQAQTAGDMKVVVASLPDSLQANQLLVSSTNPGEVDSRWASIGWRASWRNLQLRVGIGTSSTPLAWILPSTELSWRMGGREPRPRG